MTMLHAARTLRTPTLMLLAPATLIVGVASLLEVWRFAHPSSAPLLPTHEGTLVEAIARDDVQRAYALVTRGDASSPLLVADRALTGGAPLQVSPVAWAVATGADKSVRMLVTFGASLDAAGPLSYRCLAELRGQTEVLRVLRAMRPAAEPPCPRVSNVPPLTLFEQR
jgi:hypothetical protein